MIDFIKIVVSNEDNAREIWENPILEYHSQETKRVSFDEVKECEKQRLQNIIVTKFYNRIEIAGSIHKYQNNGIHNANDFSFIDSIKTIGELIETLKLNPEKCKIVNLEFGLNVIPGFDIKKIITWLKYHERNEFRLYPDLQYAKQAGSYSNESKINKYKIIKAYAKGLQRFNGNVYGHPNTFRFEVRSKRASYINKQGVFTLLDLLRPNTYKTLSDQLLAEFDRVLILDKRLVDIGKYGNSDFWEDILQQHRNKFTYHRKRYFEFLEKHPGNLHKEIRQLLETKLIDLSIELLEKLVQFSHPPEINRMLRNVKKEKTIVQFSHPSINENMLTFAKVSENKLVQFSQYIRVKYAQTCKITGLDISMQKDESILLSHTGLYYYMNNEPEIYNEVKREFFTKFWQSRSVDTKKEVKEIAHNIRNRKKYIDDKQNRIHPPGQGWLF